MYAPLRTSQGPFKRPLHLNEKEPLLSRGFYDSLYCNFYADVSPSMKWGGGWSSLHPLGDFDNSPEGPFNAGGGAELWLG